jgi:hypothetical protein
MSEIFPQLLYLTFKLVDQSPKAIISKYPFHTVQVKQTDPMDLCPS